MASYVDGFVFAIPKNRLEEFRQLQNVGPLWMEHGALQYVECIGDDLEIEDMVSFRTIAGAKEDETVAFSFIRHASREDRDKCNAAVMADPRLEQFHDPENPPFNFKRMAYGGFQAVVEM